MNPIVVIPARMASTRLPGKPLADIDGKPMIVHMLDRGREAGIGPVAVACGDPEIADAVRAAGGRAVLTDPALPSGSDRVHAALAELDPDRHARRRGQPAGRFPDAWTPRACASSSPRWPIRMSISAPWWCRSAMRSRRPPSPSSKPPARSQDGQTIAPALYFSRQAIPWGLGPRWHHVGIYAYRRAVLDRYVSLPPSPLEQRESLEQLRALENGMRIACVRMEHGPFGVDTAEDLERARALLARSRSPRSTTRTDDRSLSRACRAPIPTWPAATPIRR